MRTPDKKKKKKKNTAHTHGDATALFRGGPQLEPIAGFAPPGSVGGARGEHLVASHGEAGREGATVGAGNGPVE